MITVAMAGMTVGVVAQDGERADPSPFSGKVECVDTEISYEDTRGEGGRNTSLLVGRASSDFDEPRLTGGGRSILGEDQRSIAGRWYTRHTWRIADDEGAWQGSFLDLPIGDGATVATIELVGEGSYDGLTAIGEVASSELSCGWEASGFILDTRDVPAISELPSE